MYMYLYNIYFQYIILCVQPNGQIKQFYVETVFVICLKKHSKDMDNIFWFFDLLLIYSMLIYICGLLAGMKNGPGSILWVDYDDGGGGHEPKVISTTVRGGHPQTGKILL